MQRLNFNGGATGDLNFALTRSVTGCDGFGNIIPADQPRFHRPRMLCGAPQVTAYGPTGATLESLFPGGDPATSEGWPFVVTLRSGAAILNIHEGLDGFDRYWRDGDSSRTWSKSVNAGVGVPQCLLQGQTGVGGGTAQPDDARFRPGTYGFLGFGDLLVCVGSLAEFVDPNWTTRRLYVAWTTRERLQSGGDPWIVHAITAPAPAANYGVMGAPWALSRWLRPWTDPDEIWLGIADYRNTPKDGAKSYALRIRRENGSYILDPLVHLSSAAATDLHVHSIACLDHGSEMLVYASDGDGDQSTGRLRRYTVGGEYAGGVQTDSGLGGDFETHETGAGWSAQETIQPSQGNQITQMEPWIEQGKAICAPDVSVDTLSLLSVEDLGSERVAHFDGPDWQASQISAAAIEAAGQEGLLVNRRSIVGGNVDRVMLHCDSPQGSLAHTTSWMVSYSPDGVHWGRAWNTGEGSNNRKVIIGNRIMVGRLNNTKEQMRWIPLPRTRIVRPLMLGPVPQNYIKSTPTSPASSFVPASTTVAVKTRAELVSETGKAPPAQGWGYKVTITAANSFAGLLHMNDASSMPADWSTLTLRFWMFIERPSLLNQVRRTFSTLFRIRAVQSDASAINFFAGVVPRWTANGRWFPVTLRIAKASLNTTLPWRLEFGFWSRSAADVPIPTTLYVALDAAYIDAAHVGGVGGPLQTAAASESAEVTGFKPSADGGWTLAMFGLIPDDAWDRYTPSGPTSLVLARVEDDEEDGHELIAKPGTRKVALDAEEGAREVAWQRNEPVLCIMRRYPDGTMTLDYSVAGCEPTRIADSGTGHIAQPERLILQESMLWSSVAYAPTAIDDEAAALALAQLRLGAEWGPRPGRRDERRRGRFGRL